MLETNCISDRARSILTIFVIIQIKCRISLSVKKTIHYEI